MSKRWTRVAGVIPCHFGLHQLHVDDIIISHKDSDLGCHGQHSRQSKKRKENYTQRKVKEISALKSSISSAEISYFHFIGRFSFFLSLYFFFNQPRRKWRFWLVGCGDGVRVYRDSQSEIFQKPTPFVDPHPFCYEKRGGIYCTPFESVFFWVCVIYYLAVESLFIEFFFPF